MIKTPYYFTKEQITIRLEKNIILVKAVDVVTVKNCGKHYRQQQQLVIKLYR